jgi:ATP-dependent helicase HrpB
VDLVPTVLALAQQGVRSLEEFPWIEPPSGDAWAQAQKWLRGVGALTESGECTRLGEELARMPVHPRIGLFLQSAQTGAEVWAARISEGELPEGELQWGQRFDAGSFAVRKLEERLRSASGKEPGLRALVRAFWDRVGRVRGGALPLAGGGEFKLRANALEDGDLVLVLDALETESGARLRSWIALEEEMLWDFAGGLLEERREIVWDESRARAEVRAELRFGALLLEGKLVASEESDRPRLEARLLEEVLRRPERALDLDALRGAWARREFARRGTSPGEPNAQEWATALRELCQGAASLDELKVRGLLLSAEEARHAPETIALPGRARVPVHYALDRDPWIESRLQDFFGLKEGPRVRGGATPLTLHLLAPNGRALQVTRDLSGFWAREYPRIRQELCRRYPRHAWPEDPLRPPPRIR